MYLTISNYYSPPLSQLAQLYLTIETGEQSLTQVVGGGGAAETQYFTVVRHVLRSESLWQSTEHAAALTYHGGCQQDIATFTYHW